MVKARRIETNRGPRVQFTFEGTQITTFEGETIAAALLTADVKAFSVTLAGAARIPFCNMGTCFDCAVIVDGQPLVRACLTDVREGMVVTRQEGK